MYNKPITPKRTNNINSRRTDAPSSCDETLHLIDFEKWLERELVKLEAQFESFTTTISNRQFFDRSSR